MAAVQVAGSNGKGSTARTLDGILREAGLNVGLYTSPHLNDLRERVRVGGRKIPKRRVARFVREIWPIIVDESIEGDTPTFFEVCTAMALWHFGWEDVDVPVIEVGIGGRYDATSVVDPVAAAVTNVSLEHTNILGSTIEEIARDKAQVAPDNAPLVTGATGPALETIQGETDVVTVGRSPADAESCAEEADITAREGKTVSLTESSLSLTGPDWTVETETPLFGQYQAVNTGIAAMLARQVADVSEGAIAMGIQNVSWPGRFEVVDDSPLTVLDGAHNPDACDKLATLLDRYDYEDLHLVFGAMRDKDYERMCVSLPAPDRTYLAEPTTDRAEDVTVLEAVFARKTDAEISKFESVLGAVNAAVESADETDCIVVAGSLYTVAEARDRWTRAITPIRTDTRLRALSATETADIPPAQREEYDKIMTHRAVRLHVRRKRAAKLRTAICSVGGECAVSDIEEVAERVNVVLSGTIAQFQELNNLLRDERPEWDHLRNQLTVALNEEHNAVTDRYPWETNTAVMGILNVTPDSFHDGGQYATIDDAVAQAEEMAANGADIIDIGGESTRPGGDSIPVEIEKSRVIPVVEHLQDLDAMVSVDTRRPEVAVAGLDAGADMVNDVTGLSDAKMRRVVAEQNVPAVVMHSHSAPVDPGRDYIYDDVVDDVLEELTERLLLAERAGIDRSQLIIDPGLGFGKGAADSFWLLDRLGEFRALGTPVMIGHSHKSMFADVGSDDDRLAATVAATALAADRGADIIRVHDVPANADAVATVANTADGK